MCFFCCAGGGGQWLPLKSKKSKIFESITKRGEGMKQFTCIVCSWVYDENKGDPDSGIAPGTKFEDIPEDWVCPVCKVGKDQFKLVIAKAEDAAPESLPDTDNSLNYIGNLERKSDDIEKEMASIYQKALTGKSEISAMRTPLHFNELDKIQFLPTQLVKPPYDEHDMDVEMRTIIGKKARKPLEIAVPFYVSSMSFGSLSKEAKIALARGAASVNTLNCSGEGGMLPEERQAAHKYIFQYSTGRFGATEEVMRQADAIEIKIGQAAKAGMGGHLLADKVSDEIAKVRGVEPGKTLISPANHPDIKTKEEWKERVSELREITGGVPIGLKMAASKIEEDLEVALFIEPDFVTIDCRGGATGAAPSHIKDHVCIPAPYAIDRARKFLDEKYSDISLLITGGFRTSADIAKAIALGADAVGLSTTPMIGLGCQQYRVCHKGTCPLGIATQDPKLREKFDLEKSAQMLSNLFKVYKTELADFVRILGKEDIHQLDYTDLSTVSRDISEYTRIKHA